MDVAKPLLVGREVGAVVDLAADGGDPEVRSRGVVLAQHVDGALQAAAGGHGEGRAAAGVAQHPDEGGETLGVAEQGSIDVCHQDAVDNGQSVLGHGFSPALRASEHLSDLTQVVAGVAAPSVVAVDLAEAGAAPTLPAIAVGQHLQQNLGHLWSVKRVNQHPVLALAEDVARAAVIGGR